jgi:hypothetical protein
MKRAGNTKWLELGDERHDPSPRNPAPDWIEVAVAEAFKLNPSRGRLERAREGAHQGA